MPRAAITDKGYDAKSNRDGARKRNICPVIPHRATATDRPAFFPKILYKARARIEQAVGKLKRFKRIALRCEKTARNYGSFVALALGLILIVPFGVPNPRLQAKRRVDEVAYATISTWQPREVRPQGSSCVVPEYRKLGCGTDN